MRFSARKIIYLSLFVPQLSFAQKENASLERIDQMLSSKAKSVTEILQDPAYMKLHSLTPFREIIKKNAKQENITLVNKNELGTPVTIQVKFNSNRPVNNLLVYVYHTDNRGWYSDTAAHILVREGDRGHARLFGYLITDKEGNIAFNTIHPQGYPKSDLPQHIHLEVFDKDGANLLVTELLFDDDARLKGEMRERSLREGFVIAKNEGKANMQVYVYSINLR